MAELVRKVQFAQFVYDNNFRAPVPPDPSDIKGMPSPDLAIQIPESGFLPLNNAVAIQWDSTAELSVDTLERGLDFLGYRIYRARRPDLDTYDLDEIATKRRSPLAWKQIGTLAMPSPWIKSATTVGNTGLRIDDFELADPIKPGQRRFLVARNPTTAGPWGKYFTELLNARPTTYRVQARPDSTLDVNRFDTFDKARSHPGQQSVGIDRRVNLGQVKRYAHAVNGTSHDLGRWHHSTASFPDARNEATIFFTSCARSLLQIMVASSVTTTTMFPTPRVVTTWLDVAAFTTMALAVSSDVTLPITTLFCSS
jgi:hypothetical protein